jgi:hypothetical protein
MAMGCGPIGLSHTLYTRSSGTVKGELVKALSFTDGRLKHTLSSNTLPQLCRKLDLGLDVLLEVDVDVEAAALVVCDRMDKRFVRLTWLVCWWVHVGLTIRVLLAVPGLELCLCSYTRSSRYVL